MTAPEIDFARVEATLLAAGEAAARLTLPLFRTPLGIENKLHGGFDPVTEADKGAETAIRGHLVALALSFRLLNSCSKLSALRPQLPAA